MMQRQQPPPGQTRHSVPMATSPWTVQSGTATITSINSATSGVTGVVAGTPAVLRWTILNGSCSSYDEVTLTNDAAPTAAAGTDQAQCANGNFTLDGTKRNSHHHKYKCCHFRRNRRSCRYSGSIALDNPQRIVQLIR